MDNCVWINPTWGHKQGFDKPLKEEVVVGERADEIIQVKCFHMFTVNGPDRDSLPSPGDGAHQGEGGGVGRRLVKDDRTVKEGLGLYS